MDPADLLKTAGRYRDCKPWWTSVAERLGS
jgi:hypothetical protein